MNDRADVVVVPHSPPAERAVLGSLLTGAALVRDIGLEEDDFFLVAHRLIFRAMQANLMRHRSVDIVTVVDALESAGTLADVGVETLSSLADAGSAKNIGAHAAIVRDHAKARELHNLAQTLVTATADNWRDVANDAVSTVLARSHETGRWDCDLREALRAGLDVVERAYSSDSKLVGIDTGYQRLNDVFGGWHNSDLIVIGARPSMGKTAFLMQLALNAQVPIGVVSAEMPRDQLALRLVANLGCVDATKLRNAKSLDDDDWPRITLAAGKLAQRQFWILDKPAPSMIEVANFARRVQTQHGGKALFLDYVQRMRPRDRSVPKHEQIGEIALGLKELARELDIPVIALAQVGREVEKRENKRPHMGDLKHSGEIEQEADTVIMLYRDEVYKDGSPDKGVIELIIDKNRHGPIGTTKLAWRGEYMQFGDLAPSSYPDTGKHHDG